MKMLQKKTNFNFMGMGKYAICLSLALIAFAVYTWFNLGMSKYGTDYVGGSEYVVQIDDTESQDIAVKLRETFTAEGFKNIVVQSYESVASDDAGKKFAIRMLGDSQMQEDASDIEQASSAAEELKKANHALTEAFGDKYQLLSNAYIGPTIGGELQRKAIIAFVIGLIGITAYITWRFEFAFALGAVVAVFHDAIVTLGIYLALGHEISMSILAAVLTIVGYSVNDTIVVFDRVREEIFKSEDYDLVKLMNECINATLSRTIITSLSTLFAAGSLLIFGGGVIRDLSLFMTIGLVVGTYSTIFIASPIVVLWWKHVIMRKKHDVVEAEQ